ncbi:hypothetical protein V8C35DRAFT_307543 [Trichoderma chlorosporum]
MGTSQPNRSPYVSFFLSHPDLAQVPKGFGGPHIVAQSAENTSSDRLFADIGFAAWCAYYHTKRLAKSKSFYAGQADLVQVFNAFEAETVEIRKSVAEEINEALPDCARHQLGDALHKANPRKRRRAVTPGTSLEENDNQQTTSLQIAVTEIDIITEPTNTAPDDSSFLVTEPPAAWLSTIFPPLLVEAINKQHLRNGWSAVITMSFVDVLRSDRRLGSMMSLKLKVKQSIMSRGHYLVIIPQSLTRSAFYYCQMAANLRDLLRLHYEAVDGKLSWKYLVKK